MNEIHKIQKALFQSDFNQVFQLLKDGETWSNASSTEQALKKIMKNERFEIVDILIENGIISLDIFEYHNFTSTIFELFIEIPFTKKSKEYLLKIITDIENIDAEIGGKNWLGFAIRNNASIELLEVLINNGCNINTIDTVEQNYLFYTKDLKLTEFLIQQGLAINKKNVSGQTVLYESVKNWRGVRYQIRRKELIQLYFDYGINVNSQDKRGDTAYDIICSETGDAEVFELLYNYDPPKLDLKNNRGRSLFFDFVATPPIISIVILEQMLKLRPNLYQEEKDPYGNSITAFDVLAKESALIIGLLLKYNLLDVKKVDDKGNSWLHKVCMEELNYEQNKATELYKKVKILLKEGADPNLINDEDKSPIDYAKNDNLKVGALTILLKNQGSATNLVGD